MAAGRDMEVSLVSPERVQENPGNSRTQRLPGGASRGSVKADRGDSGKRDPSGLGARQPINPRNTFEHFVVGPGNQLAQAACVAVANAPAQAYNPLFLYGDTGLGKTHLMHAVAHQAIEQFPELKISYLSCEKFTNEFIRAIQENTLKCSNPISDSKLDPPNKILTLGNFSLINFARVRLAIF